jgi:hypothetical protein
MIGRLFAFLAIATLASSCARVQSSGAIALEDRQFYSAGPYSAYASPWSSDIDKTLAHGRDFTDRITVLPGGFPKGTHIEWDWPLRRSGVGGVWGYMEISYGNYDGGEPKLHVEPRQVRDIRALSQDFAWSHGGIAQFNLLNEFYLTRNAGKTGEKVIEIGLLLHPYERPGADALKAKDVGRFVDRQGRAWDVILQGTFCMFVPERDVLEGHVDIRAMLQFLIDKSVISGDEWFNGLAFGVEPVRGWGSIAVDRWHVDYR